MYFPTHLFNYMLRLTFNINLYFFNDSIIQIFGQIAHNHAQCYGEIKVGCQSEPLSHYGELLPVSWTKKRFMCKI